MRCSSRIKKVGVGVLIMGSLVGGMVTAGHAAENLSNSSTATSTEGGSAFMSGLKHAGGFFKHLFTGTPSPQATPDVLVIPADQIANKPDSEVEASAESFRQPTTPVVHANPVATTALRQPPPPEPKGPDFDVCSPMKDGEIRNIDDKLFSAAGALMGGRYQLRKSKDAEGKDVFEARLNIHFTPVAGEPSSVVDQMRSRTLVCYQAADSITGPNGEKLVLTLADGSENIPRTNVSVQSEKLDRENSGLWTTQSECAVIVHETMHLLALVDTYKETAFKTKTGELEYDCRSEQPKPYLMSNIYGAQFADTKYQEMTCACNTPGPCTRTLAKITSAIQACPAGTDESDTTYILPGNKLADVKFEVETNASTKEEFDQDAAPLFGGIHAKYYYKVMTEVPATPTLLLPAEFRAVTLPGCKSANSLYYTCTQNAYRTSIENGGGGCLAGTPPECKDPSVWLQ